MGRGLASSSKIALPPHIAPEGQQPAKRRWGSYSAICNFQRGISRQRARINVFKIPVTTRSPKRERRPRDRPGRARKSRAGLPWDLTALRGGVGARERGARVSLRWCYF